jgi:hypothetical protein
MALFGRSGIGRIPVSMPMWGGGIIQRIGEVASIYRMSWRGNDANDAVPYVHRILRAVTFTY